MLPIPESLWWLLELSSHLAVFPDDIATIKEFSWHSNYKWTATCSGHLFGWISPSVNVILAPKGLRNRNATPTKYVIQLLAEGVMTSYLPSDVTTLRLDVIEIDISKCFLYVSQLKKSWKLFQVTHRFQGTRGTVKEISSRGFKIDSSF